MPLGCAAVSRVESLRHPAPRRYSATFWVSQPNAPQRRLSRKPSAAWHRVPPSGRLGRGSLCLIYRKFRVEELDTAVVRFDAVQVWGPDYAGETVYLMLAYERLALHLPPKWRLCTGWTVKRYEILREACCRARAVVLGRLAPTWVKPNAVAYIAGWRQRADHPVGFADLQGIHLFMDASLPASALESGNAQDCLRALQLLGSTPARVPLTPRSLGLAGEVRREIRRDPATRDPVARIDLYVERAESVGCEVPETEAMEASLSEAA